MIDIMHFSNLATEYLNQCQVDKLNIIHIHDIYLGKLKFSLQVPMHCYMHLVARGTVLSYKVSYNWEKLH